MERNANYALVGLISTILLIAMIVFIFWLTNFALSARYDQYDVVFHGPITGLSRGGDVQFNGIKVGETQDIKLDPSDPSLVHAFVRVRSDTPVRQDSTASLEPQGITGVNYIQITAGTRTVSADTTTGQTVTVQLTQLPLGNTTFSALAFAGGRPRSKSRLVSAIGARNQNTAGQPQRATTAPPINGPSAEASAKISVNMPTACARRASG